jgi:hypothetical protein
VGESNGAEVEKVEETEKKQNATETKGEKMSQERHDEEIRQQAKAEVGAGKVVPGSGRRGKPRRMAQMVSVRLDGELIGGLRLIARERNVTLSDLLREGAELILEDAHSRTRPQKDIKIFGAQQASHETASQAELALH